MGRPLNKKYFGNRNIGTGGNQVGGNNSNNQNYADDRIGGEGIDSINWSTLGSFRGNGALAVNGLALPAPTLPGGVQAVWDLLFEVESVTTGAGNTNLAVGDTFIDNTKFPGMVAKVTSLDGGAGSAVFSVTVAGASRGNALTYAQLVADTQTISLTQNGGTGTAGTFTVDVNYRVKSTVITEKGSGYTGAETFTVTLAGAGTVGTPPAGTLVLKTDTGAVGSATNQENAIVIRANLGEGVEVGDIIRQVSTRRYKVKLAAGGVGIVELESGDSTPNFGKAMIVATSVTGDTYYVTKLTGHKATLATKTGSGMLNGKAVQWTFGAPSGSIVQIENA